MSDVTGIVPAIEQGDPRDSEQLLTLVYDGRFGNSAPYDSLARFGAVVEWSWQPTKR